MGRILALAAVCGAAACSGATGGSPEMPGAIGPGEPISDSAFAAISARISEPGGYFDTDNLISNEDGYLKVLGALDRLKVRGGAYVGVGPDQNFSYIADIRPDIAFIVDIRRDNLLEQLLLKTLIERAPTRVQFLSGLTGRPAPADTAGWRARSIDDVVAYVDTTAADSTTVLALRLELARDMQSYGIPLSPEDMATIRRFHGEFIRRGMSLRFTSAGRAPRPYYPTYRGLVTETDLDGNQASYLSSAERYGVVRGLERDNRVIPVVGDLAGDHALHEMATVLREMGLQLTAFYTSNVEFYLWRASTFTTWVENLSAFPATSNAVVIRSFFPNFGGAHPSAVPGYHATQTLQPVAVLEQGGFSSYYDLVTKDVIDLRIPAVSR
ncbi:MAG: hypothetical protein LJF04_16610 [Gemmatimonadetes bacterium]|nr:hypothetical protein [Gemmatimonadota bacterium]